ncbi:MAG: YqhA family protein [Acidimicrobiaceae bacterium]|jgi:uncharacterized membrane protein YqhA|nr:YqhA family protein [Ilumatobacteraceae bacterium]
MTNPQEKTMNKLLNSSRYLVIIAVIGLSITTIASFGWSVAKSVQLIVDLMQGEWRSDMSVVRLLSVIDMYLISIVQLIVVIGLYELFIDELQVPEWLRVDSLNDLKKSIIDVLVVFMAVKGIEGLLKKETPLDALIFSGAVGILILVLTVFRWQASLAKGAHG